MKNSDKMICDGCKKSVHKDSTNSCCSSHVELPDFGIDESPHFDDNWYCQDCLNQEGFCKTCCEMIPQEIREKIGKFVDENS